MSDSKESRLNAKIEELRRKVRIMPRGGDLGGLLDEEVTEIARLLREELAAEREGAASLEADFSPSGVPALPGSEPVESGPAEAQGRDDSR